MKEDKKKNILKKKWWKNFAGTISESSCKDLWRPCTVFSSQGFRERLGPWERARRAVRETAQRRCSSVMNQSLGFAWMQALWTSSWNMGMSKELAKFPSSSNIPYLTNEKSTRSEVGQWGLFVVAILQTNHLFSFPLAFVSALCPSQWLSEDIHIAPHRKRALHPRKQCFVFTCAYNLCVYNLVFLCLQSDPRGGPNIFSEIKEMTRPQALYSMMSRFDRHSTSYLISWVSIRNLCGTWLLLGYKNIIPRLLSLRIGGKTTIMTLYLKNLLLRYTMHTGKG